MSAIRLMCQRCGDNFANPESLRHHYVSQHGCRVRISRSGHQEKVAVSDVEQETARLRPRQSRSFHPCRSSERIPSNNPAPSKPPPLISIQVATPPASSGNPPDQTAGTSFVPFDLFRTDFFLSPGTIPRIFSSSCPTPDPFLSCTLQPSFQKPPATIVSCRCVRQNPVANTTPTTTEAV